MTRIDWMLLITFGFIPLWSILNSAWVFFKERRIRPFHKAQMQAKRFQRRVGVPNPRGRKSD